MIFTAGIVFSMRILAITSLGILFYSNAQIAFANEEVSTPPAIPVEIVVIEEKPIRMWTEFSGRLVAVNYVEIRPQTTGIITEVKFKDGQFINKGDILYIIDPRSLKAIVAQKKATLIAAQSSDTLANKDFIRAKDLLDQHIVSQQFYDERKSIKLVADSMVKQAEAQLSEARINLSYAYVKAPISGHLGRSELTEGNLVSAGLNPPILTSIVSSGSIYADFEVDEQTYMSYIESTSSEQIKQVVYPVELQLQNGDTIYQGQIYAFDNRIDPASGTIRARAVFDNLNGQLLPGMYARLKLGSVTKQSKILVSERAIGTDQNRNFVYVVNDENKTTYREVQLGESLDGERIISSGLATGDKVIVRGLMRLQPNMLVEPSVAEIKEVKF